MTRHLTPADYWQQQTQLPARQVARTRYVKIETFAEGGFESFSFFYADKLTYMHEDGKVRLHLQVASVQLCTVLPIAIINEITAV
jgi:hypothetical protein